MLDFFEHLGFIGIPLTLLSVYGLALIVERVLFFCKQPKACDSKILKRLEEALIKNKNKIKKIRDEIVSYELNIVREKYLKNIRVLRIIAVITPMLGLLGTVIGIISAFKVISLHDGPVYPALIADGLWVAMTTTAYGLSVALPCLFAAFVFARIAEQRITFYENELNRISLKLEGVDL